MKQLKKIPLFFTPIMIAMLVVMLIIASFSWYSALGEGEVVTKESSKEIGTTYVSYGVQVGGHKLGDKYVNDDFNGDNYYYDKENQSYIISKSSDGSTIYNGYYGQTGLGSLENNSYDKPYICFYEITLNTDFEDGIFFTSAYVCKFNLKNEKSEREPFFSVEYKDETESDFTVEFYDKTDDDVNNLYIFTNPSKTFSLEPGTKSAKLIVGIKFYNPLKEGAFRFSSIDYYNLYFQLFIAFK